MFPFPLHFLAASLHGKCAFKQRAQENAPSPGSEITHPGFELCPLKSPQIDSKRGRSAKPQFSQEGLLLTVNRSKLIPENMSAFIAGRLKSHSWSHLEGLPLVKKKV